MIFIPYISFMVSIGRMLKESPIKSPTTIIPFSCQYGCICNLNLSLDHNRVVSNNTFSTTMGLKYPLKKFDSQWPFPMIAIYGTMHHVGCLATWPRSARHVLRHAHYILSFPDYLLFIYLWDVAEIGSWTCVPECDISYIRGQNFHHGTRQRLVPRWKFCPLV